MFVGLFRYYLGSRAVLPQSTTPSLINPRLYGQATEADIPVFHRNKANGGAFGTDNCRTLMFQNNKIIYSSL